MTHGTQPREPRAPVVSIWPGPTLKVWIDGCEAISIPLTIDASWYLASQLLAASVVRMPPATNTPTENLTFAAHMDAVRDRGVNPHADNEAQP